MCFVNYKQGTSGHLEYVVASGITQRLKSNLMSPGITQRDRGAFVTGAFVAAVSFKLTSMSFWNTLDSTHNASDMFCFVFVN